MSLPLGGRSEAATPLGCRYRLNLASGRRERAGYNAETDGCVWMKRKRSAHEIELHAVQSRPLEVPTPPASEAIAMLVRRGFRPEPTPLDAPFPVSPIDMDERCAERLAGWLGHYAFRLFLRGAILRGDGFTPSETTRYVAPRQAAAYAEALLDLGLAEKMSPGRYRLRWQARSFGGALEWYVARELRKRFGFDVASAVKLHARGAAGDLDVVAAGEGKLLYFELKSSPPRNLSESDITAFCDRIDFVRPDLSFFVVDTALRLNDKIVPMFVNDFARRKRSTLEPERIDAQQWALTPRLYLVNGSRDLMRNIGKALAAGLRALSPGLADRSEGGVRP